MSFSANVHFGIDFQLLRVFLFFFSQQIVCKGMLNDERLPRQFVSQCVELILGNTVEAELIPLAK